MILLLACTRWGQILSFGGRSWEGKVSVCLLPEYSVEFVVSSRRGFVLELDMAKG